MSTRKAPLRLLTQRQAARQLRASEATLERWRSRGEGPPWLRIGKRLVRYDPDALRAWVEAQLVEKAS